MGSRQCSNHPDKFCYVCGRITFEKQKNFINETVKSVYKNYFQLPISHQDKLWAPHVVCASCYATLNRWNNAWLWWVQCLLKHLWFGVAKLYLSWVWCYSVWSYGVYNLIGFMRPTVVGLRFWGHRLIGFRTAELYLSQVWCYGVWGYNPVACEAITSNP